MVRLKLKTAGNLVLIPLLLGLALVCIAPRVKAATEITGVTPDSCFLGESPSIVILGTELTGATEVTFGTGVTVGSFTVDSDTQITAQIAVSSSTTPGVRSIRVTTPTGTTTFSNGFTLKCPPPVVSDCSPEFGEAGEVNKFITLTGQYFVDVTMVSFGAGVTTTSFSVSSSITLVVQITINTAAVRGTRDISVISNYGTGIGTALFNVLPAPIVYYPPTINTVTPASLDRGAEGTIVITGTNFGNVTSVDFGEGTTSTFLVNSATQMSVRVLVRDTAIIGQRTITVYNLAGSATSNVFSITLPVIIPPLPKITSIIPGTVETGTTVDFNIVGSGLTGLSVVALTPGNGISNGNFTVVSDTQIIGKFTIARDAPLGSRSLAVTTPGGVATLNNALTVVAPPVDYTPAIPEVLTISVSSGNRGENLEMEVGGKGFTSVNSASLGRGITVNNLNIATDTKAYLSISIDWAADDGSRNLTLASPTGRDTLEGCFTVALPIPTVTGVSINYGKPKDSLEVVVSGSGFVDATIVSFGGNITVSSFTVVNSSIINTNIDIGSKARGSRSVIVVTNGGTGTLPNGFDVMAGPKPSNLWKYLIPAVLVPVLLALIFWGWKHWRGIPREGSEKFTPNNIKIEYVSPKEGEASSPSTEEIAYTMEEGAMVKDTESDPIWS